MVAAFTILLFAPWGYAAGLRLPRLHSHRSSNFTLRKRLHVNPLIAEPGTAEIDCSSLYSLSSKTYTMPTAVKYTPEGRHVFWGRTEYGVAFDLLANVEAEGGRVTQFGDMVTLAANSVLLDGQKLDIAVAPEATVFLREEAGARLGATAIARYDTGRNSLGATLSWTGATHSSPSNRAGTLDAGLGFGRRLLDAGLPGKFTPHVNFVCEKSTGVERVVSFFEGVEYQINERVALDLSGQHLGVAGGARDHQIVLGITVSLGR
jgi:hypothetical protein